MTSPPQPLDVFACPLAGTSLIEASAGTGKTWNLCGLYLRLLLEQRLEVQEILVVTFTNAATAELRDRIRSRIAETFDHLRGVAPPSGDPFVGRLLEACRERHGLCDDDMQRRLDQALQSFDQAAIFTIHGFCQRALGDMPFVAGMPMALELVVDDIELRLDAVHDFWRRRLAGDALQPALARHLLSCGDTPASHAELLKKVLAKPLSKVLWPSELDRDGDHGSDAPLPFDDIAVAVAHAEAQALWQRDRALILARVERVLPGLNRNRYKEGYVELATRQWDALLGADDARVPGEPGRLALLTASRLVPNKGRQPIEPHPFFAAAERLVDAHEQHRNAARLARLRLLRDMLADCSASLRKAKRAGRVIAFDDMLWNVHERLSGPAGDAFATSLRERFKAALIDEFQDTDPIQFAIFKAIYGGRDDPLFLVGDPKQAIYSFRNADLHTYLEAHAEARASYTLTDNQRSSAALLDGLNALFGANPRAFMLDGLGYHAVACGSKARPAFVDRSEARAPLQLWSLPAGDGGEPLAKADARRRAGDACADEIARLLAASARGEVRIGGRALGGGDMAVLVRSHSQGADMRAALAARGVASVQLSDASLFESTEAEEVSRVLAAIVEPREALLRGALSTDLLGIDAAGLQALDDDEPALLAFVARFAGYRARWLQHGIAAMLRELMLGEGVTARLLARADGERRLTNLRHLAEFMQQAAGAHPTPESLLRWLQAQRSTLRIDEANQLRLESDRDLVQIVTIHKAKGLEYPIVFCPFLWDGRAVGNAEGADCAEYHDAGGAPVLDFRIGDEAEAALDEVSTQLGVERAAEELRLVYVALTRAVLRVVVVVGAYLDGKGSPIESGRAVVNWLVAGAGLAPEAWLKSRLGAEAIATAWQGFAAASAGAAAMAPLPVAAAAPVALARSRADALAARAPPQRIDPAWWIGSYSSLAHGTRNEGAALDHDLRAIDDDRESADALPTTDPLLIADASPTADAQIADAVPAASALPAVDDILAFPRGPEAGVCLHSVFEQVDFSDPWTFPAAIDHALRGEAAHLAGPGSEPLLHRMLGRMLADVTSTPLPDGLLLASVPRGRCLVEMEFTLPSHGLVAARLAALLRRHDYPLPSLAFQLLDGYLRGFIDLVFEQNGRFHLCDWKSNHLGTKPADYGHGPIERAMRQHGYHLQYLLYTVALHRFLGQRLPGYRYDDHFGSVLYLFVRGVRPGWRNRDGSAAGVYAHRPSRQVVEELSALFDARGATG